MKNVLSRAEQLKIYAKCLQDPTYAIESFLETFDMTQKGYVPFKLFPKQKEIVWAYEKHRFNIVTKPRQAGVSTTTAAYQAVKLTFADENNPEKVLIIANKRDMAMEFLAKIKDFLDQIPRWVWGQEYVDDPEKSIYATESKQHLVLVNGSQVKAVATSKDALRGYTPTWLIMDEAAYIENGEEVFGASLTALGTGGRASLISTPNGMDALYYKTYDGAKTKRNNFNVVEMRWYQDLRYNKDLRWIKGEEIIYEKEFTLESYERMLAQGYKPTSFWYEEMCRSMNNNARMIAQELDVSFIGSGGNVIDEEYIGEIEKYDLTTPIRTEGFDNNIWIWNDPEPGHQYIMGVDVSRGDGEDSSTFFIYDFTTNEQVAEYCGKIPPDVLAQIVYEYGNKYMAYTVVDITGGMGVTTVLKLLEMEYKYLHYDDPRSKVLATRKDLGKFKKHDNKMPGFNVGANRLNMIAELERVVRQKEAKVKSTRITSEMKTFVYKNGRPDHMDGYHDDCLMAMAMTMWVLQTSFKNLEKMNSTTKAMLNSWMIGSNGSVSKVSDGPKPPPKPFIQNRNLPNSEHMWLFGGMK